MADEGISNNVIAALLVVAIVLSIGGFYMIMAKPGGITGAFTDTGKGAISASAGQAIGITLTDSTIALGEIAANGTASSAGTGEYFLLENDGNVVVDITAGSTKPFSSATKCTGALPCAGFYSVSAIGGSNVACVNNSNMQPTGTPGMIIGGLKYVDGTDTAKVGVSITIPGDEPPGNKGSTVTFVATEFDADNCPP